MIGKKIPISEYHDSRGVLTAINELPFEAKRVFFIYDVPKEEKRGDHFSKTSKFLYIVIKGCCKVLLEDGFHTELYDLKPGEALLFTKNTWMKIDDFIEGTVLCVLSDNEYKSSDYSSDYEEFKRIVRGNENV
jgi:hypothetical protein